MLIEELAPDMGHAADFGAGWGFLSASLAERLGETVTLDLVQYVTTNDASKLVDGQAHVCDTMEQAFIEAGLPAPDRSPPAIEITPAAAEAISRALENGDDGAVLHLSVDPRFNARFELKPASGNEVVTEAAGIRLHLDLASVPRARGLRIDWVEDARGAGLAIHNPNAPPPVKSMSVQQLHDHIIAGTIDVVDVRPAHARAIAPFPHPHEVLDEDSRERLEALPRDVPLAFLCHHGNSSRQAAEYFRGLGFHDIYNVEGGIEAWSSQIDPSVPRY